MPRPIRILTYPLYLLGVAFEISGIGLQLPDEYVCGNVEVVTEDAREDGDERK